jgi:hypothetical protein
LAGSSSALTFFAQVLLLPGLDRGQRRAVWQAELADHKEGVYSVKYDGEDLRVCRSAYCVLRGMSDSTLQDLLRNDKRRKVAAEEQGYVKMAVPEHGRVGKTYISEKTAQAARWLWNIAYTIGERCPVSGLWRVFMFFNVAYLFAEFVRDLEEHGVPAHERLKERSFRDFVSGVSPASYLLRGLRWARAVVQKVCASCQAHREERMELYAQKALPTDPRFAQLQQREQQHLGIVMGARTRFNALKEDARAGRLVGTSLKLSDASKPLKTPRKLTDTEVSRHVPQLKSLFLGHMDITRGVNHVYYHPANGIGLQGKKGLKGSWEDADVQASIMFQQLRADHVAGRLEREQIYHIDGGSDVRNFLTILVLGLCIALGWLDVVKILCLIPGHTHIDVDALFSLLRRLLKQGRHCNAVSFADFVAAGRDAYPGVDTGSAFGVSHFTQLTTLFRWKDFFGHALPGAQRCLSKSMVGLFGVGKGDDPNKPRKVVLSADSEHNVVVQAFKIDASGTEHAHGPSRQLFQRCPLTDSLQAHDLLALFQRDIGKLIAHLESIGPAGILAAGMPVRILDEYRTLLREAPSFCCGVVPHDVFLLDGVEPHPRWARLLTLPQLQPVAASVPVHLAVQEEALEAAVEEQPLRSITAITDRRWDIDAQEYEYKCHFANGAGEDGADWVARSDADFKTADARRQRQAFDAAENRKQQAHQAVQSASSHRATATYLPVRRTKNAQVDQPATEPVPAAIGPRRSQRNAK